MKHGKRILSLALALIMVLGLLPLDQLQLIPVAEAAEKSAETVRGSRNITIDYDYGEKYGVTDAKSALTHMADENNQFDIPNPNHDEYWQTEYDSFQWKHVTATWTVWEPKKDTLRKYLQSTDPEDKYICLMRSDVDEYYTKSYMWRPMVISSDKVLDLNGQTLNIRYDANKTNTGSHQTPNLDYHYLWAFEITNGATLTIIDSSIWRGEGSGLGTGAIRFTGYMMNPYYTQIFTYTTRDLFHVDNGNLVIYGGTFQAGRKKDNSDDKVTWDDISTVIGSAVELGVSIAGYATGLNTAVAGYKDLLQDQADQAALKAKKLAEEQDNLSPGAETMTPKDGTNQNPAQDTKKTGAEKEDVPTTVEEKKTKKDGEVDKGKPGTKEGENKKDDQKPAKNDANTKLADEQNKIVNKAMNKDAIMGVVNSAFGLVNNIVGMFSTDVKSRISNCINGTVVKVGSNSTFVAYGGTFDGYGSTPNVRNAVVEVVKLTGAGPMPFDHTKTKGGLAYIYGGTFNAYHGANVFNMVRSNEQLQQQWIYTRKDGDPAQVNLSKEETGGVKVIYYDNEAALAADTTGTVVPIPVNTANIQVRGGTFRCHYDLVNVATVVKGAEDNFAKFPGTSGSVNLGVESFNENLIKDGRIQIVDTYGDGALVLLDDKTAEKLAWEKEHPGETYPEGLYEYRLFCGDTELRSKAYLTVAPNTAKTNSSHSLQLTYYDNDTGTSFASVYKNDENNTRAAARQTETFFDFPLDRENTVNYDILPLFYSPEHTEKVNNQDTTIPQNMLEYDVYGQRLASSEVWYYPQPVKASNGDLIGDVEYGDVVTTANYNGKKASVPSNPTAASSAATWYAYLHRSAFDTFYEGIQNTGIVSLYQSHTPKEFVEIGNKLSDTSSMQSHKEYHSGIRTNMGYYVYKLYKVDPLTRENLSMSGEYGTDVPLLTVRYGDSTESLRCKLPLIQTQNWILDKNHPERNPYGWQGFQTGEMYRVVLEWEEYMGIGYQGNGVFGQKLPAAKTQASILFRCYNVNEKTLNVEDDYLACDYTPLQLTTPHTIVQTSYDYDLEIPVISAGQSATVQIINGKAGMTDYKERKKVFDVYYQWWECDEKGNLIRMIAGTDNIYEKGVTKWAKTEHSAAGGAWHLSTDGKTYVNTVDPNDPRAYTYIYNDLGEPGVYGLPGTYNAYGQLIPDRNKWNYKNLHMYTSETYTKAAVSGDGSIELSLENNNVFASNTDSCYIPEALEGKFVRVRAIVMNYDWEAAYDPKQTFLSHVIKIKESDKPLTGTLTATFADGVSYAAEGKPVSLHVDNLNGLYYGEKITGVTFSIGGYWKKELTGLSVTKASELSQITAQFPNDFFAADDIKYVPAQRLRGVWAHVVTDRRPEGFWFGLPQDIVYQIEAKSVQLSGKSRLVFDYEEVKAQAGQSTENQPFAITPYNATAGLPYADAVTTDEKVAKLDSNGCLVFGGSAGTATITVQGPDGASVSVEIGVYHQIGRVDISNVFAPTVGEPLPSQYAIPAGVPYTVSNYYWTENRKSGTDNALSANSTAQDYTVYTVNVELTANENYIFKPVGTMDFQLSAYLADGTYAVFTRATLEKQYSGKLEVKQTTEDKFLLRYTFDGLFNESEIEINKIYLDFPDEVPEGLNFDTWLEEASFYTNGNTARFERAPAEPQGDVFLVGALLGALGRFELLKEVRTYIQKATTGVQFIIQIPNELSAHFPSSVDDITFYVNGVETQTDSFLVSSHRLWIIADDIVSVVNGRAPEAFPPYQLELFRLAKDAPLYVPDLLQCEDEHVSIHFKEFSGAAYDVNSYLSYDPEAETITVLQANSSDSLKVVFEVWFDADRDGKPEYIKTHEMPYCILYETGAAVGEPHTTHIVTAYNPDGSVAYTKQVERVWSWGEPSALNIPEIPGALISKVSSVQNPDKVLSLPYGADRIKAPIDETDTNITVRTVAADSLEIHPGATEVYAWMKDADGNEVEGINLSIDGVHFQKASYLTGLEPKTEYTLFYRQGVNGAVYAKTFRTAKTEYHVYVGRNPVTDENLGDLEGEGWHYEPSTKTLTLKNFYLKDPGYAYMMRVLTIALRTWMSIYAEDDLTIELIGDNTVINPAALEDEANTAATLSNYCITCLGSLTIQGTGNLTMKGGSKMKNGKPDYYTEGLYATQNVNLNGSGTLTFTEIGTGIRINDKNTYAVNYTNGDLVFTGGTESYYNAALIDWNTASSFNVSPYHGADKITCKVNGSTVTLSEFITALKDYNKNIPFSLSQQHTCNSKIAVAKYLATPDKLCTEARSYYYSCSCGAHSSITFTVDPGSHALVPHVGLAPTCTVGGYAAYQTCSNCAYSTYTELPALGHDWEHHDEEEPTCTADGKPAYDVCRRCGQTTELLIPAGQPGDEPARDGTPNMTISDAYDSSILVWKAKGHSLVHVSTIAPTCTAAGAADYYQCEQCGKKFSDIEGGQELTDAALRLPANGHAWGEWTVSVEATASQTGTWIRTCETCGATDTKVMEISERKHFQDVFRSDYYFSAVENMYELGVTDGTSEDLFSPGLKCTRGQVVTFLWRLMGCPAPQNTESPFTDVDADAYYYDAVLWAVENNITNGISNTKFSPNGVCTRAQVVTFLWRASGSPEPKSTTCPFTDVRSGAYYYKPVLWAVENGITNGVSETKFSPSSVCIRGQVVTFLDRTPVWKSALEVGEQPVGGELDQAANDPCLILSAEGESGLYPYTYEWYKSDSTRGPDQKIEGANLPNLAAFEPGQYYCAITDANGDTVYTDTVTVTAKQYPAITAVTQPVGGICTPDEPLTLSFEVTGGAGVLHYHWYRDGQEYAVSDQPGIELDYQSGTFYCEVTDRIGQICQSDSVRVTRGGANRVNLLGDDDLMIYTASTLVIPGRGLQVTGTIANGTVRIGNRIHVYHNNTVAQYRVLSIQKELMTNLYTHVSSASTGETVRLLLDTVGENVVSVLDAISGKKEMFRTENYVGTLAVNTKVNPIFDPSTTWALRDPNTNQVIGTAKISSVGTQITALSPRKFYENAELTLQSGAGVLYVGQEINVVSNNRIAAVLTITEAIPNRVEINETNFPDDVMRESVSARDFDEDGFLSSEELEGTTDFDFSGTEVADIRGVELFYNLIDLTAENTKLTYADLRGNRKLKYADFVYSPLLTELRTEGLTELKTLEVYESNLQKLDLSDSTKLESLDCSGNPQLKTLSLNSASLSQLSCYGTNLTALDLSGCPLMLETYRNGERTVFGSAAEYTYTIDGVDCTLIIDKNVEVLPEAYPGVPDWVEINETNFPDATFRGWLSNEEYDQNTDGWLNPAELAHATYLYIDESDIVTLKGIELLYDLDDLCAEDCEDLTTADLRANKKLTSIDFYRGSQLTDLRMDGLTEVTWLNVQGTNLMSLDLSDKAKLSNLFCDGVAFTTLDISHCPILVDIYLNGTRTEYDGVNGPCWSYKINDIGWLLVDKTLTVITQ